MSGKGVVLADPLGGPRHMVAGFGFAICDQALFAGTSFILTLLLGRWMTQENFGRYSVTFAVFVLLQNVYESLILEPFSIFGSGRLSKQLNVYIGRLLIGHIFSAGTLASIIILTALVLGAASQQSALAKAFLSMGLVTPFLLARMLTRQPFYITARVHWSAMTGVVYLATSVAALYGLRQVGHITPVSAFLALGSGSMFTSVVVLLVFLDPVWSSDDAEMSPRRLVVDHLNYGGWALGERLLLWVQIYVPFLVLTAVADLHAGATYRTLSMLSMPASMAISAVGGVVLPALVRAYDAPSRSRWVQMLTPGALAVTSAYSLLLVWLGRRAAGIAFAGRYDTDLNRVLLIAVGLGLVLFACSTSLELQLRALLMIRRVLIARLSATVLLVVIGIPLIVYYRLLGAVIAADLTWVTTVVVLLYMRTKVVTDRGSDGILAQNVRVPRT